MIGNSRARFRDRDYHPLMLARVSIIALLVACLVGCASTPPPPAGVGLFRLEDQGYSLLYNLMESESKVGDIFILKPADASLETLVRDIGKTCDAAKRRMDDFRKADGRINYDISELPYIEQRSRDLQTNDDTKALLFSSGDKFAVRMIFTQAEAMNYAMQLSRALSEKEDDATRKTFLINLAKECSDYHDRLMKMLAFHPSH
jgi:hypothetical protein